jgi:cystathionine beta-lyase
MDISEILFHLGEERENYYNAVSPPVIQSSNFVFPTIQDFRKRVVDELNNNVYTRGNNPTNHILRKKIAALEKTEDALVVSSGSAAVALSVLACVKQGDHVVCVQSPYSWTQVLFNKFLTKFGISTTYVDGTDIENIRKAIQPNTTVLYLESPNSLTFEMQDLKACADLAKANNIITIIDNSFASPIFQNPAVFGIDLVIHSGTKYLNGHSDVVLGVICASNEWIEKIFKLEYMTIGAILSPHDANLVIRGLRTLELRMERTNNTAIKVLNYLRQRPEVVKIYHPFEANNPQKELAHLQMSGTGGLFSVLFNFPSIEVSEQFFNLLKKFTFAVSWGGHESLIFPTCALYNIEGKANPPLPHNFYRFYVGLEDADYLIADIEQALGGLLAF